ncbi:MAG: hypothetical protein OXB93_00220, partial [Cytophagales bacterium]|nr:hypothetical protein [Cytophagales bacterium]
MKKISVLGIAFGILLSSGGCALKQMIKKAEQQQIAVTPSPLELHGGEVSYEVGVKLPVKILPKGKIYTLTSYFDPETGDPIEVGKIEFKAEDYPGNKEAPVNKSKRLTFTYQPEYERGTLLFKGTASNPANGKYLDTPLKKSADGIITTPLLVENDYAVSYAAHGYNDQEEIVTTKVVFYFTQGSAQFRRKEIRSKRGRALDAFIAEKNLTRKVYITGTHSPEGTERINTGLSERRAVAVQKWYKRQLRKYDYKNLADSIGFQKIPVVQDWTHFKKFLETYEKISEKRKKKILAIVDGRGSFEDKEKALSKKKYYRKLLKKVYPKLRTAQVEIRSVLKKKTRAEISAIAQQYVKKEEIAETDTLSIQELLFAAHLSPDLEEKEAIYQVTKQQQDTWIAHNNLGAIYLNRAAQIDDPVQRKVLIDAAVNHVEIAVKARGGKAAPEVSANLAVAYLLQGNDDRAYDKVVEALESNPVANTSRQAYSV